MGFQRWFAVFPKTEARRHQKYEEDLLQMAQLRNAIVHEKIGENFVIAEPNQWVVTRIQQIEQALLQPETVLPKFGKSDRF